MSSTEPVMISQEMMYLFGSVVILLVVLFVQSVTTVLANGIRWGLGPRDVPAKDDLLAGRARRTVQNHIEGLVLFGFAVLIIEVAGLNSDLSRIGAALYFWARLAFAPAYLLGIPNIRTLIWLVSLAGILIELYVIVSTGL